MSSKKVLNELGCVLIAGDKIAWNIVGYRDSKYALKAHEAY